MATTTTPRTRRADRDRRFLLRGVRWKTYVALRDDLDRAGSRLHLTYDRGKLEIMSPARKHERNRRKLGRLIEALTQELNLPIESGGSTTFRRQLKKRGLEPDECYWIQNEARVRGKDDLDLDTDPPPDLALEVEHTRPLVDKLSVYAGLGFPEVWRYDGKALQVALLQADGSYRWGDQSGCFPWLPLAELVRFLDQSRATDETTWIRSFHAWVRAELAPHHARPDDRPIGGG